jgi:hypothetical protein
LDEASVTEDEDHLNNENLQCRFYRKDFPEEGDLVIVIYHVLMCDVYRHKSLRCMRMELM